MNTFTSIYEKSKMYKLKEFNLVGCMDAKDAISLHAGWEFNEKEKLTLLQTLLTCKEVTIHRNHYYDFDRAGFTEAQFKLKLEK